MQLPSAQHTDYILICIMHTYEGQKYKLTATVYVWN